MFPTAIPTKTFPTAIPTRIVAAFVAIGLFAPIPARAANEGEKVYDTASPAVVSIDVSDGQGSGVVIDPKGLILTNAHVVGDDRTVTVSLKDGSSLQGNVIALGRQCTDLALVQLTNPPQNLPSVQFGDQILHPGQTVFAIGNPRGYAGSLTQGIVSRLDPKQQLIQTSVPLNPGNSGGALLNETGQLIGINTKIASNSQGISFSIPLTTVNQFLQDHKTGQLGRVPAFGDQGKVVKHQVGDRPININSELDAGDPINCNDKSYYDRYEFTTVPGQPLMVRMESSDFQPYLVMMDDQGKTLDSDENQKSKTYALVIGQAKQTKTYRVLVNSRAAATGKYKLTATPLLLYRVEGFEQSDAPNATGKFERSFTFKGNRDQTVRMYVYSSDFVPSIQVKDSQGQPLSGQAPKLEGSGSVLDLKLPQDGPYTVTIAAPAQKGGKFFLMAE
jgi:hypothetical protein